MDRIRSADRVPVILEHRYVVHQHCPRLTRLQAEGSLYHTWTKTHGLEDRRRERCDPRRAVVGGRSQASADRPQSPALEVVSVGYLEDDSPLWWERTLYRGDQYEFHSRLGPIQSATPARGKLR
jgi:GntR family transcriptional regulator